MGRHTSVPLLARRGTSRGLFSHTTSDLPSRARPHAPMHPTRTFGLPSLSSRVCFCASAADCFGHLLGKKLSYVRTFHACTISARGYCLIKRARAQSRVTPKSYVIAPSRVSGNYCRASPQPVRSKVRLTVRSARTSGDTPPIARQ